MQHLLPDKGPAKIPETRITKAQVADLRETRITIFAKYYGTAQDP
jgi:hypothetical protein